MSPRQSQAATAQIATNAIAQVLIDVQSSSNWLFREQPTNDFGIDAHAELVENGEASGRLVALQVKGGSSAFARPVEGGWHFPVKARHAQYWLGHSLPVVLVLADLDARRSYWQVISSDTLKSTGKNFKVHVPASQLVSTSADAWGALTARYFEDAEMRFDANQTVLPPSTARELKRLAELNRVGAQLLSMALAAGRHDPKSALEDVVLTRGGWLDTLPATAWAAVATFARDHDAAVHAGEAFIRAAERGDEKAAKYFAQAAIAFHDVAPERGEPALEAALERDAELTESLVALAIWRGDASAVNELSKRTGGWPAAYFGRQAFMAGDDSEAVRRYRDLVEEDQEFSTAHYQLALVLGRRALGRSAHPEDAGDAAHHALIALTQMRKWTDDTAGVLEAYLRALALGERLDEVVAAAKPEPDGTATATELASTAVARIAMDAASRTSQPALAVEFASRILDETDRQIALDELTAASGTDKQRIEIYRRRLARAQSEADLRGVLDTVTLLASLGVDETSALDDAVSNDQVEADYQSFLRAWCSSKTDPKSALPDLRRFAQTNLLAADVVVTLLKEHDTLEHAIEACRSYYSAFPSPLLLNDLVRLLVEARELDEAAKHLEQALQKNLIVGVARYQAHGLLGEIYGERKEYAKAAEQFRLASSGNPRPTRTTLWNLIQCLLLEGREPEARAEIEQRQLEPASEDEIRAWAQVMSKTGWTDDSASLAVSLAMKAGLSPQLAGALLTSIIRETRGTPPPAPAEAEVDDQLDEDASPDVDARPEVRGDIHREAFVAIDSLIAVHGDDFPLWKIQVGETREEIEAALKEQLARTDDRPERELLRLVRRGDIPLGMRREIRSDPYSYLLARRDVRVATSSEGKLHSEETEDAEVARGGAVVIDLSGVDGAIELGRWESLFGEFNAVIVTTSQRADSSLGVRTAQSATASSMWVGLDRRGEVRVSHQDPDAMIATLRRCEEIEETVRLLRAVAVDGDLTATREFEDIGRQIWLDPIELAAREGASLWSDDLGQRHVARLVGVPSFSTASLIEAKNLSLLSADTTPETAEKVADAQLALVRELIDHRIVDQPVSEADLLHNIEAHRGEMAPAAEIMSRPSWWLAVKSLDPWRRIAEALRAHAPETIRQWQAKAMFGLLETAGPDAASRLVAMLAVIGCGEVPTVEDTTTGMLMADEICVENARTLASRHLLWALAVLKVPDIETFAQQVREGMSEQRAAAGLRDEDYPQDE